MKKPTKILLNLFFLGLGIFLLYLALRNQDLDSLFEEIKKVNLFWVFVIAGISIFNQIIRALRWHMLSKATGLSFRLVPMFWALIFGFMVSLAIPRFGEISRSLVLSRKDSDQFAPLFGTVIVERAIDVLCLGLVQVLAFSLQFDLLWNYFFAPIWESLSRRLWALQGIIYLLVFLFGLLLFISWYQRKSLLQSRIIQWAIHFAQRIWMGITSVFKLPSPFLFLAYTFLIWYTYFLMSYLWFFSLEATQHLDMTAGLTILALGSLARLAPTQGGGLGAYQLMVTQGFVLLGIAEIYGAALAIIIHSTQIVLTLVLGLFSLLYFSFYTRESNLNSE
ncbi:MAG: lysylphosphatidylglycerol synthase transmembrane domain-containing protein [Bacteroidota bacterium]